MKRKRGHDGRCKRGEAGRDEGKRGEVGAAEMTTMMRTNTRGQRGRVNGLGGAERTDRPFSLSSLSLIDLLNLLNSRFDFALSTSTMRFWRCHRRQLRFSRRCPCSRKLATFVQT